MGFQSTLQKKNHKRAWDPSSFLRLITKQKRNNTQEIIDLHDSKQNSHKSDSVFPINCSQKLVPFVVEFGEYNSSKQFSPF